MTFDPRFWEVTPGDPDTFWKMIPETQSPWFETETDRYIRAAQRLLFEDTWDTLHRLMIDELTDRQWEVVQLYLKGLPQEDIATTLQITQSTVSRTLFGCRRNGKTVGGVITKMQAIINGPDCPEEIRAALRMYQIRRRSALINQD